MQYDVFRNSKGHQAVVTDPDKLPGDRNDWKPFKKLTVNPGDGPRIGADSDEIINNVNEKGYHLWPDGANDEYGDAA